MTTINSFQKTVLRKTNKLRRRAATLVLAGFAALAASSAAFADRIEDFSDEPSGCGINRNTEITLEFYLVNAGPQFCVSGGSLEFSTTAGFAHVYTIDTVDTIKSLELRNVSAVNGQLMLEFWDASRNPVGWRLLDPGFSGTVAAPPNTRYVNFAHSANSGVAAVMVDSITYSDPVDPFVLSASVVGLPHANATTVDFEFRFNTSVTNVSADDFVVTTVTGDATANILRVQPAGYTNTVEIGEFAGEGRVRVDLRANTDIRNRFNTGNPPPAYTNGGAYEVVLRPPAAPSTPDLAAASDTGSSDSDNLTSDSTPTFTGTADANVTVTVLSSPGGTLGTTTADGSGNWSFTAPDMAAGTYQITATATDAASNTGDASAALTLQIDTAAPTLSLVTAVATPTADSTPDFVFSTSEDGTLAVGGSCGTSSSLAAQAGSNKTIALTQADSMSALADGTYSDCAVLVTDAAGNASTALAIPAFAVDTAPRTVTLSVDTPTITDESGGAATVTATLSAPALTTTTVSLAFSGAAVGGGTDYSLTGSNIVIPAGQSSGTVRITSLFDGVAEADETIVIDIASVTGATESGTQQVIVTIVDEDFFNPSISVTDASAAENAGPLTFTVRLSASSPRTTTVDYATSNGTAAAGSDYTATTGALTFSAGETEKTIAVPLIDNSTVERDETFTLTLSNPVNASLDAATATGTITNDDSATISIEDRARPEGGVGIFLTITMSAQVDAPVTFLASTADGAATAPADYTALTNVLVSIPTGNTLAQVGVLQRQDSVFEPNEHFLVNLTDLNASGRAVTFAKASGTATIIDDEDPPRVRLSATPTTIAENGGTSTLTASFFGGTTSFEPVTVALDYSNAHVTGPATIVVPAGSSSADVTVTAVDNTADEPDRQTVVSVSSVTGGSEFQTQAVTLTLTDDDAPPTLTIADVSVAEGNSGSSNLTFTVRLSAASAYTVSASYSTIDTTAQANVDYDTVFGTLTFAPGEIEKTVDVPVTGDAVSEPDETFRLTVTPTNATPSVIEATGTILNDDGVPSVTLSASPTTLAENGGTSTLTATLPALSSLPVTVALDYSNTGASGPATIVIPAGSFSADVTVTAADNAIDEPDRTVLVSVSSVTNGVENGDQAVTLTLTDDDGAPSLSVADASIAENEAGSTVLAFTARLSVPSGRSVTADYATSDVTAQAGADYTAARSSVSFAPGETEKQIQVTVLDDAVVETDETFALTLTNAVNAVLSTASATGTITDDDAATLAIADLSRAEGEAGATAFDFVVTLSSAVGAPVSFTATTADGTAQAGSDYVALAAAPFVIPAGGTSATVTVTVTGDATFEPDETFTVTLAGLDASGLPVTFSDAAAAGTIANDDAAPNLTLSGATVTEDSGTATVVASLGAPAGVPVNFSWSTSDGGATAPEDYLAVSNRIVTIPAGQTRAELNVTIVDDTIEERAETFVVTLSGLSGALATANEAPVTIEANDLVAPQPVLSADTGSVSGPFTLNVLFDEPVTGLELSDFSATNATLSALSGADAVYTMAVTPAGGGSVTISLAAGAAVDAAGAGSRAAAPLTVQVDKEAPALTIALPGEAPTRDFEARFVFSEPVSGFDLSDISVVNGTATNLASSDQTEFTVQITPQAPGTVTVSVASGAAQDTVGNASLGATSSVEAVAEAEAVALELGQTTPEPGAVAGVAKVSNPGSAPLPVTAAVDANWINVTPTVATISPLGTLDFTVSLTDAVNTLPPGDYTSTVIVAVDRLSGSASAAGARPQASAGGTILVEIPVSLSVEARFGALTLVATTPPGASGEASFAYASDVAEFDGLTLTTSGGRASARAEELFSGAYQIAQTLPAGWRVDSISCAGDLDGGSRFDLSVGIAVVDLDPSENLTCTFKNVRDEDAVRLATQRAIRGFMVRRADRIVEAAPDLSRRFAERQTTRRGGFTADIDGSGRYTGRLSGSLAGARNAAVAETPAIVGVTNYERPFLDGWDVWFAAEIAGVTDDRVGEGAESDVAIAQLGVDFEVSDTLLLGLLAQYDRMSETAGAVFAEAGAEAGARVEGEGWMVGPYAVWRIHDSLILDALATAGRSDNRVDPLGLYEDAFGASRYMIRANLTGELVTGGLRLRPQAGLTHYEETQEGYVDSLGIAIPGQTVSLGRLRAGPELAWRRGGTNGGWIELNTALNAVWDYQTAELLNQAGELTGGDAALRADVRIGLSAATPWGALIRLETGLDGLGVGDFKARTGRVELRIPFGAPGRPGGGGAGGFAQGLLAEACADLAGEGFALAARLTQECAANSYAAPTGFAR